MQLKIAWLDLIQKKKASPQMPSECFGGDAGGPLVSGSWWAGKHSLLSSWPRL